MTTSRRCMQRRQYCGGQSRRQIPSALPGWRMKRLGGSRVFECEAQRQEGGRHTECACYFAAAHGMCVLRSASADEGG